MIFVRTCCNFVMDNMLNVCPLSLIFFCLWSPIFGQSYLRQIAIIIIIIIVKQRKNDFDLMNLMMLDDTSSLTRVSDQKRCKLDKVDTRYALLSRIHRTRCLMSAYRKDSQKQWRRIVRTNVCICPSVMESCRNSFGFLFGGKMPWRSRKIFLVWLSFWCAALQYHCRNQFTSKRTRLTASSLDDTSVAL